MNLFKNTASEGTFLESLFGLVSAHHKPFHPEEYENNLGN
jgi:hypothetical protein